MGQRVSPHVTVFVCLVAVPFALSQAPRTDAAGVVVRARTALGGDARIGGVQSLRATGRTVRVRGESLVPIEVDIIAQLPDRYVRTEITPSQPGAPTPVPLQTETAPAPKAQPPGGTPISTPVSGGGSPVSESPFRPIGTLILPPSPRRTLPADAAPAPTPTTPETPGGVPTVALPSAPPQ